MRHRNMERAISEYRRKAAGVPQRDFTLMELRQINEMDNDPFSLIHNALMAGWAIGYRTAKQEGRT